MLNQKITDGIKGFQRSLDEFKDSTGEKLGKIDTHLAKLNGTVARHETAIAVQAEKSKVPKGMWVAITGLSSLCTGLVVYLLTC